MTRDTDRDWTEIGNSHPYYGVLANNKFLNPGPDELREFFASGERDVASLLCELERAFGAFSPVSALDFGCGVGRLVIPMARRCAHAVGVDISAPMLELAQKHSAEFGVNVEFAYEIPQDRNFDWVNSLIVLQHIPPARGYGLVKRLWNAVAPGGFLSLHLTAYKDSRHVGEINRDMQVFSYDGESAVNFSTEDDATVGMSMYDYNFSRVFSLFALPPGATVFMKKIDHGGCHGFIIFIKKAE